MTVLSNCSPFNNSPFSACRQEASATASIMSRLSVLLQQMYVSMVAGLCGAEEWAQGTLIAVRYSLYWMCVISPLSHPIPSYPILSHPILSHPILSHPIPSYPILSYSIQYSTLSILSHSILPSILSHPIPS